MRRRLPLLLPLLLILAGLAAAATHPTTPPPPPRATASAPVATVDDSHLVRTEQARATRAEHRRVLHAAQVRAAAARARAAAARAARAAAQRAAAARTAVARYARTAAVGVTAVWRALAQCESGGNWHDTDGDYEGGVQFLNSTWLAYGGGAYARHAYDAAPIEQVTVARRVLNADGPGQWPVCGPRVGLRRGD